MMRAACLPLWAPSRFARSRCRPQLELQVVLYGAKRSWEGGWTKQCRALPVHSRAELFEQLYSKGDETVTWVGGMEVV